MAEVVRLDPLKDAGELVEVARSHLRVRFDGRLGEDDVAELAQQAYADLLQQTRSGYEASSPGQLIRTIAFRLAVKRVERLPEIPVDADDEHAVLAQLEDPRGEGWERLRAQLAVATAAEALAQLPRELQLAFKYSREEVPVGVAAKRLGLSRSGYHKYRSQAIAYVRAALAGENAEYERELHDLVSAFVLEVGALDRDQRRRARRLIRSDPIAAALAAELRRVADGLGAAVPPLAAGELLSGDLVKGGLSVLDRLRDSVHGLLRGAPDAAEAASSPVLTGGTRGVGGVAGAGLLAKLGLSGPAVTACLATGATVTACLATGVIELPRIGSQEGARTDSPERVDEAPVRPAASAPLEGQLDSAVMAVEPVNARTSSDADTNAEDPDSGQGDGPGSPARAPSPEPVVEESAPPTTQQFGVEAAATPAAGPAPADTNDGDGASAGTVRQEFGP